MSCSTCRNFWRRDCWCRAIPVQANPIFCVACWSKPPQTVQQVVIDRKVTLSLLAERYGHLIVDAADQSDTTLRAAGERVCASIAPPLFCAGESRCGAAASRCSGFSEGIFVVTRTHWYPVLVFVDEAQLFAQPPAATRRMKPVAFPQCHDEPYVPWAQARLGRGHCNPAPCKTCQECRGGSSNFLMGRTFLDIDMVRAGRSAGNGETFGGWVSRPRARAVHGAGACFEPPPSEGDDRRG